MLNSHEAERRAEQRVRGPFSAMVLDVTAGGQNLGVRTVLEDLSAGGFYLRMAQPIEQGKTLLVITQVADAMLVLCGTVSRVEASEDGTCGLAVIITQHQMFSLRCEQRQAQQIPS